MDAGKCWMNLPHVGATTSKGARAAKATDDKYILAGTLRART